MHAIIRLLLHVSHLVQGILLAVTRTFLIRFSRSFRSLVAFALVNNSASGCLCVLCLISEWNSLLVRQLALAKFMLMLSAFHATLCLHFV